MRRIDKRKSACYFIARIKKPLKRRSNRKGRPQRAGELLRTRGRCAGKWIAEGKGKGASPRVSGPCARVKGRGCVGTLVRVGSLRRPGKGGTMGLCLQARPLGDGPFSFPPFLFPHAGTASRGQQVSVFSIDRFPKRKERKEGFPWQKKGSSTPRRPKAFPFRI